MVQLIEELTQPVWCVFFKVYLKVEDADRYLAEILAPIFAEVVENQEFKYGFFIRYVDPEHHIRIRFFGSKSASCGAPRKKVEAALRASLKPYNAKLVTSKYRPEFGRYGGKLGVRLAEHLFCSSSTLIFDYYKKNTTGIGITEFALASGESMLASMGLNRQERDQFYLRYRQKNAVAHNLKPEQFQALNEKFAPTVKAILEDPASYCGDSLKNSVVDFEKKLYSLFSDWKKIERKIGIPMPRLASSYLHMHWNRMGIFPSREMLLREIRSTHSLVPETLKRVA